MIKCTENFACLAYSIVIQINNITNQCTIHETTLNEIVYNEQKYNVKIKNICIGCEKGDKKKRVLSIQFDVLFMLIKKIAR